MRLQGTALQAGAARCSLCSVQGLCPWFFPSVRQQSWCPHSEAFQAFIYCCPGNSACRAVKMSAQGVPSPCYLHLALNADGWEGARDDEIFLPDTYDNNSFSILNSLLSYPTPRFALPLPFQGMGGELEKRPNLWDCSTIYSRYITWGNPSGTKRGDTPFGMSPLGI